MRRSPAAGGVFGGSRGVGFSGWMNVELDGLGGRVHNLSSVLQTGFKVWRSEDDL